MFHLCKDTSWSDYCFVEMKVTESNLTAYLATFGMNASEFNL